MKEETKVVWHQDVADGIWRKAIDGLVAAAAAAVGRAKAIVPVDTGALRDSIVAGTVDESGESASVDVSAGMEYGRDVEMGTSRQRPQPYLRPSIDADKVAEDVCKGGQE